MKNKFKDKYVLAEGYPWTYNTYTNILIGMNKDAIGITPIELNMPNELWDKDVPKYKLVLEKIKE
jgi:hypothetical protein